MTTTELSKERSPSPFDRQRWRNFLNGALPYLKDFFLHVIAQVRVLKKAYPGLMHLLIFWGVTIQVIGTAINLMQMQLFIPFVELSIPRGNGYLLYELIMDLAGVAILLGVAMAAIRRAIIRPKTLETRWDDTYALVMLALIPIVGFTLEALRLTAAAPEWARWSQVGYVLSRALLSVGLSPTTAAQLHNIFFWSHIVLALVLVASLPYTKLRHLVQTPLNVLLRPHREDGVLEIIENIDEAEILGTGKISEFSPQQLLSFDACVSCGRCEEVCPAFICGMDYTPRSLVQTLRTASMNTFINPNGNGKVDQELIEGTIPADLPWACTTCGACLTSCPAFVNPVDAIVDLRRYQTLTTGKIPKSVADVMRNMERQGNPWGMPPEDRLAWADGLEINELAPGDETDVLIFLGCAFAYDDRNKKVARSFVNILQREKVDFAVLGLDEMCCGETARRMGHEYLFQMFAEQNIEMLSTLKFKRIVTQCPHCFNTLKNEYPQMGGEFEVLHYTEFLSELMGQEQLIPSNGNSTSAALTYQDSCYLGRYNQIYKKPRKLLDQAGYQLVEMADSGENSFCCGGGGGQMWMETDADQRINQKRMQDALDTAADTVATACPYCLLMFDDAIRSKGISEELQVLDIAELLDQQYQPTAEA